MAIKHRLAQTVKCYFKYVIWTGISEKFATPLGMKGKLENKVLF